MNSNIFNNIILAVDSYKITHHFQYPEKTELIYSYFESRGGKFKETVFFGLQYIIKKWLLGKVVTMEKIQEANQIFLLHFGRNLFNEEGWTYIAKDKNGYLPLRIKAVSEGSVVPVHNVLFTVENTDPRCYWLTNYIESLLVQVWYPLTVATISRYMKKILIKHLRETADNLDGLEFQLHDFGFRGCTSVEASAIGGAAHLVNFRGTDTISCLVMVKEYYNEPSPGFSIPASEHSTITTWGLNGELKAFENMLDKFPKGSVSCVSDSYDVYKACDEYWGIELKSKIVNRDGVLVIRPDSGDPIKLLPEILHILGQRFGSTNNSKGFKMLPPYVRIIQGDGIDVDSLDDICLAIRNAGWSVGNVNFGCGGGLLQKHNRDTQKCAFKCSYAIINGLPVDVFKQPITDPDKKSKKGKLILEKTDSGYITRENGSGDPAKDVLTTVFENGKLLREYSFQEIRNNARLI